MKCAAPAPSAARLRASTWLQVVLLAACVSGASGCAGTIRTLPPFSQAMSDGCSHVPDISRAIYQCCVIHDEAFYYGGSVEDKLRADAALYFCMRATGDGFADVYFAGVVLFGGPEWREPGVSWAFGGDYFRYSKKPAKSGSQNAMKGTNGTAQKRRIAMSF